MLIRLLLLAALAKAFVVVHPKVPHPLTTSTTQRYASKKQPFFTQSPEDLPANNKKETKPAKPPAVPKAPSVPPPPPPPPAAAAAVAAKSSKPSSDSSSLPKFDAQNFLESKLENTKTVVETKVNETKQKIDDAVTTIQQIPTNVKNSVDETVDKVDKTVKEIQAIPGNIKQSVDETVETIDNTVKDIQAIPGNIKKSYDDTVETVDNTVKTIQSIPEKVKGGINAAWETYDNTVQAIEDTKTAAINTANAMKKFADSVSGKAPKTPRPPKKPPTPTKLSEVDADLSAEVMEALKLAEETIAPKDNIPEKRIAGNTVKPQGIWKKSDGTKAETTTQSAKNAKPFWQRGKF